MCVCVCVCVRVCVSHGRSITASCLHDNDTLTCKQEGIGSVLINAEFGLSENGNSSGNFRS